MSTSESSGHEVGNFATGESHPKDHPEEEEVGTFATGESDPKDHPEEEEVGTFATGQEELSDDSIKAPMT